MTVDVITVGSGVRVVQQPGGGVNVISTSGVDVVSTGEGVAGADAAQDIMFSAAVNLMAGEKIDAGPLERASAYATVRFFSRTGVASNQVIAILNNDVQVATITVVPASLPTKQTFAVGPLSFAAGDVPTIQLPSPADGQLADFTLTLGSTP